MVCVYKEFQIQKKNGTGENNTDKREVFIRGYCWGEEISLLGEIF